MAPVIFVAAGLIVLFKNHRQIQEALENFRDNFRGGPPTAMHPSPAGDDALLRHRASGDVRH